MCILQKLIIFFSGEFRKISIMDRIEANIYSWSVTLCEDKFPDGPAIGNSTSPEENYETFPLAIGAERKRNRKKQ